MDQVVRHWGSLFGSAICRVAVFLATWSALTAGSGDDRVIGVGTAGLAQATT
jgi:hypothetical protein